MHTKSSPWLIAVTASVAAGMIHAAAAGAHSDDRTLAALFAAAAALQVGWAVWALVRPGVAAAISGLVLQLGVVGVWAVSRTRGIGLVDGLAAGEDVAFQDVTAVALEFAAVVGIGLALLRRPAAVRKVRPMFAGAVGVIALAAVVPAMSFPHSHGQDAETVAVGHAHPQPAAEAAETADETDVLEELGLPPLPDMPGATEEHRVAAVELIAATSLALARYTDVAAVEAAGYQSIGDGFTGFEHFVHYGYLNDETVLDPATVESLVFKVDPHGRRELVSGMFIMPRGNTMADVPEVAGPYTVWHDHQNLCWHPDGRLAGILVDGKCTPGGTFRATPPMLHVWIVEHPCGQFAGIEGSHGAGCSHEHTAA